MLDKKGKFIVLGILILSVIMILFFVFIINNNKIDTEKFNQYLNNGDFEKAYKAYSKAESDYKQVFETYIDTIIGNYNNSVNTYNVTLLVFAKLTNSGFSGDTMENCKEQIRILHGSKEVYKAATTLLNDNKILRAQEYYAEVVEMDTNYSDAQEKVIAIDENIAAYSNADLLYLNNEIDKSYIAYKSIVDAGINTEAATYRVETIENVNTSWDKEFKDGTYDKCTYPYEAASKDDYIYLPYSYNGIHSIVKCNLLDDDIDIFAIAKMPGSFVIEDINIVGEYIYFIAGENVGNGKMINNPYSIYRMKNDGTGLECVSQGDYKNLIAYRDGFYASSYSQGILKLDRNFNLQEQIYKEAPIQMQLVFDQFYFTVDAHNPYRMQNAQYVYDGKDLTYIKQKDRLRFGLYSDTELYTYRSGDFYYEKLFIVNDAQNKNYMLKFDDIRELYGLVGNNIVYSSEEIRGQVKYFLLNPENSSFEEFTDKLPNDIVELEKIWFDKEIMIFSTSKGFALMDSEYNLLREIDLSEKNIENIVIDNQLDFTHDELYSENEVVIVEDGFWYYSNSEYNIRNERRYMDNVDTNIYVAHIRSANPNCIQIDSPTDDTYITKIRKYPTELARQYDAVFACNGDFFDHNAWTGISIRNGTVYKSELLKDMAAIYPDGSLICYSRDENITSDDLLDAGVKNTLSFGPILLSGGEYGNDLYTNFLSHPNPRNGIGMIEPGHYVIILADGRQPNSAGLALKSYADLFKEEGCIEAYNLDGGQSATMMFMGEFINTHINDIVGQLFRSLPEIIYFGTSDLVPDVK